MAAALGLITTVLLLVLGTPVFVALGLGGALLFFTSGQSLLTLGQVMFTGIDKFPFLAVPLFVLTGELISTSGIGDRLVAFARAAVGHVRGGLTNTTLLGAGFFAGLTGSDSAETAAIGKIMMPQLVERVPRAYAAAVVASGSTMGIIIPPSIMMIIYAHLANVSVGQLFIAGIIPGILCVTYMIVVNTVICRVRGFEPASGRFSLVKLLVAGWHAKWALIAPLIILGSLYTGVATATESAAIAALYALVVGLLFGDLKSADLPGVFMRSAMITGVIMPIVAAATMYGQIIGLLRLPEAFVETMLSFSSDPNVVIFIVIAILFVAGCIMDPTPNLILLGPLIIPLASEIGVHEIHYGIIIMITLAIGFITPPFGVNLFVISHISGEKPEIVGLQAAWFVIALMLALLTIVFIPHTALLLPNYMY